ncbi:methyltransferase domain-containing protein [Halomonas sp. M20]|uniref:methyltransferase domain-containing protein n=1 Tax=Halomonas sp. M20 TaxID=2763264 RepID=UPI001D0B39E1|nr:methyltransferase domain-containing protein [Halomonas sp. M20]
MSVSVVRSDDAAQNWRRRVARAFSRAAPRYLELASAQARLGETLWPLLPQAARTVLDLGCGPGHWSARLAAHYPAARVWGLDLAPGMLAEARRRHGDHASWLCADATALPLASGSMDLVFSNLALQWCPRPEQALREIRRVLRPGGLALINTLGPGTLAEVARAWSEAGRTGGVLAFDGAERHLAGARRAGFRHVELQAQRRRFHYADFGAVRASIKGVGAQVARPGARLGRADLVRAEERYEALREPAGLPVSYHLFTLQLKV